MKVIVIPRVRSTSGIFTFIKYKWYYSLILRELRWYFLLIPHLQKIQQFMKQMIVIYLQQMRAPAARAQSKLSIKKVSVWTSIPLDRSPPGYKTQIIAPDISPWISSSVISPWDIWPGYKPPDISTPYISPRDICPWI